MEELFEIRPKHKGKSVEKKKILIVDDVPRHQQFYEDALGDENFEIIILESWKKALPLFRKYVFALILVNVETVLEDIPKKPNSLFSLPSREGVPLIGLTSRYDRRSIARLMEYGYDHFVVREDLGRERDFAKTVERTIECL